MNSVYKIFYYSFALDGLLLICSLTIFTYILYKTFRIKVICKNVFIENTFITYSAVIVYFLVFILGLLLLRFMFVGHILDLKIILTFFKQFLVKKSFKEVLIFCLLLFNMILLWVIIFIKSRNFLSIHLLKFHLYFYNYYILASVKQGIYDQLSMSNKQYYYINLMDKVVYKYGYNVFIRNFKCYLHYLTIPFENTTNTYLLSVRSFILFLSRNAFNLFRYIFFILLFVLFFYDCFYNNYIITKIYYYLFFYIIFLFWFKLSFFLYNTDHVLNAIIFERCYCFPNICYVNITEEEDKELLMYINNYCIKVYKNTRPFSDFLLENHPLYKKRFIKILAKDFNSTLPYEYIYLCSYWDNENIPEFFEYEEPPKPNIT